jgi:hypothetical protein
MEASNKKGREGKTKCSKDIRMDDNNNNGFNVKRSPCQAARSSDLQIFRSTCTLDRLTASVYFSFTTPPSGEMAFGDSLVDTR